MSKNRRERGAQSDYVRTSRRGQPFSSDDSDYRNQRRYNRADDYDQNRWREEDYRYGRGDNKPDFDNDESRTGAGYGDQYENWRPSEYSEREYYGRGRAQNRNYGPEDEFTPYRSSRENRSQYYGSSRNPGFGNLRQSFDSRYRGQTNNFTEFDTENYRRSDRDSFLDRDPWNPGDNWRAGEFRGKGPRGYTRSDERIQDDINDMLTDNGMIDASDIEVRVDKGDVTLTGHVNSKRNKRLAEDLTESVSGVKNIENRIRVRRSSGPGQEFGRMSDNAK